MVTYSTNWMGPISLDWFRKRGLTREVSVVLEEDQKFGDLKAGDTWTYAEITTNYAGGRIDIRDDSKYGYDGWDEYGVAPMHIEDWNALSDWLDTVETDDVWSYDQLISQFEKYYGKRIRWADDITN